MTKLSTLAPMIMFAAIALSGCGETLDSLGGIDVHLQVTHSEAPEDTELGPAGSLEFDWSPNLDMTSLVVYQLDCVNEECGHFCDGDRIGQLPTWGVQKNNDISSGFEPPVLYGTTPKGAHVAYQEGLELPGMPDEWATDEGYERELSPALPLIPGQIYAVVAEREGDGVYGCSTFPGPGSSVEN